MGQGSEPVTSGLMQAAVAAATPELVPATFDDEWFVQLRREVNELGHALGSAIRKLSGEEAFRLEEDVRTLSKEIRRTGDPEAVKRLRERFGRLSLEEAQGLLRAFSIYLHLVNTAEERHRVRLNAERNRVSSPATPRRESPLALVGGLAASGMALQDVQSLLASLRLHLTFTAHPTETRRRTVRHHLASIASALDRGAAEELRARVALLWSSSEVHTFRPTVEDEVRGGLAYLPSVLWQVLPRLVAGLERAVEAYFGRRPSLPPPVVFRSWIGGDRDGNPNVLPQVTAWAQEYARGEAVRRYLDDLAELERDLSVSDERVAIPDDVRAAIDRVSAGVDLPERRQHEPFRQWALAVRSKLQGPPSGETPGYVDDGELADDLQVAEEGLARIGLGGAAALDVHPLGLRARSFGLDLVSLDLREGSRPHARAVAELLREAGVTNDYEAMAPDAREALLTRELASARPLAPIGHRAQSRELAVALGALAAWRARGAYVISMTRSASDVLEVMILAREVGLYRPGVALPFDIAPLFETLADLEASPAIVGRLLANPLFLSHVRGRGGLEVMIGYSDSNKDAGFLAANWALYRAQETIAATAVPYGVPVWFFHGRGTSTARGGGSAGRAIASLPPCTVGNRIRLTEQGEALADRYSHPDLAYRNLEQLLFHLGHAAARDREGCRDPLDPAWRDAMEGAARASAAAYRGLLASDGFFELYEQLTPIREIGALKIASRPVYRSGRVRDISDLRAIPWVMSWTQIRLPVPAFFGLGEGLETIPLELRRTLAREWPFFASTLDSAAAALGKADPEVARQYLRLVEPRLGEQFFPILTGSLARARAALEETLERPLLGEHPIVARQIELRDPYIDPISHLQVELLHRYRTTPEDDPERGRLEQALMASIIGIAAGLRNAG